MEWEDKVEMIRLGKIKDDSNEDMKNYKEFVLKHLDEFDVQAVDMFITNETLYPEKILYHIDFYRKVYNRFTEPELDEEINNNISLRANIRLGVLEGYVNID